MVVARVRAMGKKEEKASDCFPPGSGSERDGKDWQFEELCFSSFLTRLRARSEPRPARLISNEERTDCFPVSENVAREFPETRFEIRSPRQPEAGTATVPTRTFLFRVVPP